MTKVMMVNIYLLQIYQEISVCDYPFSIKDIPYLTIEIYFIHKHNKVIVLNPRHKFTSQLLTWHQLYAHRTSHWTTHVQAITS